MQHIPVSPACARPARAGREMMLCDSLRPGEWWWWWDRWWRWWWHWAGWSQWCWLDPPRLHHCCCWYPRKIHQNCSPAKIRIGWEVVKLTGTTVHHQHSPLSQFLMFDHLLHHGGARTLMILWSGPGRWRSGGWRRCWPDSWEDSSTIWCLDVCDCAPLTSFSTMLRSLLSSSGAPGH